MQLDDLNDIRAGAEEFLRQNLDAELCKEVKHELEQANIRIEVISKQIESCMRYMLISLKESSSTHAVVFRDALASIDSSNRRYTHSDDDNDSTQSSPNRQQRSLDRVISEDQRSAMEESRQIMAKLLISETTSDGIDGPRVAAMGRLVDIFRRHIRVAYEIDQADLVNA